MIENHVERVGVILVAVAVAVVVVVVIVIDNLELADYL